MTSTPQDPTQLPDLDSTEEIRLVVTEFYRQVAQHRRLGQIFIHVAQVDWPEHIELITSYWCRVLLQQPGYDGALLQAHREVHAKYELRAEHFADWFDLWCSSLDATHAGPITEIAKSHAAKVANLLAHRVSGLTLTGQP